MAKSLEYQFRHTMGKANTGSYASRADRLNIIGAIGKELHKSFRLSKIENLKQKHVTHLVEKWKEQKIAISSIKNRVTCLRSLAKALGKDNLIPSKNKDLGIENRSFDYNSDKGWTPSQELKDSLPEHISIQIELMRELGLRFKEAALFRPNENVHYKEKIDVIHGTKGGRPREVPITNQRQLDAIERAKAYVDSKLSDNIIKVGQDFKKFEDSTRNTYRDFGITKENIGSVHGLRHQYAQDRYLELTGWKSPAELNEEERKEFKASMTSEMKEIDRVKRLELSNELGHNRVDVVANYVGKW